MILALFEFERKKTTDVVTWTRNSDADVQCSSV